MKLVLYPTVDSRRFDLIREAAGEMTVVNAGDEQTAATEITDADAFHEYERGFFPKVKPFGGRSSSQTTRHCC